MSGGNIGKIGFKKRMIHRTREVLLTFVYLALFFCYFTSYGNLVAH